MDLVIYIFSDHSPDFSNNKSNESMQYVSIHAKVMNEYLHPTE